MREVSLIAGICNHSTRNLRSCEALSRYGNDWTAAAEAAGSYRKKQQLQQQMHHRQKQKQQLLQRVSCSTCGIHNLRSGDRTVGCALQVQAQRFKVGASTDRSVVVVLTLPEVSRCNGGESQHHQQEAYSSGYSHDHRESVTAKGAPANQDCR